MARISTLGLVGMAGVLLWSSAGVALARCGSNARDAAAVAAVESAATAQCDCCSVPGAPPRHSCIVRAVKKSVRDGTLPRRCASKSVRDTAKACPLAADVPCQLCQSDIDCRADQSCDCIAGACVHAGGVCATRPDVCPDVVAPVCGCDGMTYANECFRRRAGACRRHDGPCAETGECADPTGQCTGQPCGADHPCPVATQFCTPACAPSPEGTCFDLLAHKCTHQGCGAAHPCLPNQACVSGCPPPPPPGRCFVTVDMQCSEQPCDATHPCGNPNELCSPVCAASTTTTLPGCRGDTDCNDGDPCTADHCANGACEHGCLCLAPDGTSLCCPGPSPLCVHPTTTTSTTLPPPPCHTDTECDDDNGCSFDQCVDGTCQHLCLCVDPAGSATCCPGPAATCAHPTTTTVPCIPFFASGCSVTSDCCEPCVPGKVAPCAICHEGTCLGAP